MGQTYGLPPGGYPHPEPARATLNLRKRLVPAATDRRHAAIRKVRSKSISFKPSPRLSSADEPSVERKARHCVRAVGRARLLQTRLTGPAITRQSAQTLVTPCALRLSHLRRYATSPAIRLDSRRAYRSRYPLSARYRPLSIRDTLQLLGHISVGG